MKVRNLLAIVMIAAVVFVFGCKKEEPVTPVVPNDTIKEVTDEVSKTVDTAKEEASNALEDAAAKVKTAE